jgi:hypothetical protein
MVVALAALAAALVCSFVHPSLRPMHIDDGGVGGKK